MNPTTATITFDGLAICCFDKSSLRWKVRFPKEPGHQLTLKINDLQHDISNADNISIYTCRGDYPDYSKGGCFDLSKVNRKKDPIPTAGARNSMRWAINLSDKDDIPPAHRQLQNPPYGNVLLEINNALFYVAQVSETQLFRVPVGVDGNLPTSGKKLFGRASGLIAADISCEPGEPESPNGVYVEFKDKKIHLPAKTGFVHRVVFRNMEPKKTEDKMLQLKMDSQHSNASKNKADTLYKGDFDIYYDSLKNASERYALWGLPAFIEGSRTDCDAVWMEDPDLNP